MYNRMAIELNIAREKRRDLLRQVEQDRLIRQAKAGRESSIPASRQGRAGTEAQMIRIFALSAEEGK